eukprot:4410227-Prymnesium_polylepis.1
MYPEEQQSPTDLKIWTNSGITRPGATEDVVVHKKGWEKYQFKSAHEESDHSVMAAILKTGAGKDSDGQLLYTN